MGIASASFIGRTEKRFGEAHFRSTFVFASHFSVSAIHRTGMVFDSRFVPGLLDGTPNTLVYLVCAGSVEVVGDARTRHDAPFALVVPEDTFEGVVGQPRVTFCNYGDPFVAVDFRLARSEVTAAYGGLGPTHGLSERAWVAARALAAPSADDASSEVAAFELARALAACGVVTPSVAASDTNFVRRYGRLWAAVRPLASNLELLSTLESLAGEAGLSVRHLTRELEAFTQSSKAPFSTWREGTRRLRLKVAILALSSHDVSIGEVARLTGYGSTEAMARAFRDAGAPAPSRVRSELWMEEARLRGGGA